MEYGDRSSGELPISRIFRFGLKRLEMVTPGCFADRQPSARKLKLERAPSDLIFMKANLTARVHLLIEIISLFFWFQRISITIFKNKITLFDRKIYQLRLVFLSQEMI